MRLRVQAVSKASGGLYLFCTWTQAFLPISPIGRFGSLRS